MVLARRLRRFACRRAEGGPVSRFRVSGVVLLQSSSDRTGLVPGKSLKRIGKWENWAAKGSRIDPAAY